jgi:HEAT repeat protein
MNVLDEIRGSKKKPKELVNYLAHEVKTENKLMEQLARCLEEGSSVEKGMCAEVMELVTKDRPELAVNYLEDVIKHIDDKEPRMKWETSRIVANVSGIAPEKAANAIPKLLMNTQDKGTVVRWSAAFALTEILRNNSNCRKEIVPKLTEIANSEQNNGVKKIYLKTLKTIGK